MTTRAFLRSLLAVTAFVFLVPALAPHASAQGQKLEGSWVTLITATDPPGLPVMQGLMTFTPNGEVLESRRLYVVSPFGPLLETGGHGAWERAAHGGFLAKFIFLVQAAPNHPLFQNGEPLGSDNIRMRLNIDQPDTLSGTFMSQARDPQGNVVFTAQGTVRGTRIGPEPLQ